LLGLVGPLLRPVRPYQHRQQSSDRLAHGGDLAIEGLDDPELRIHFPLGPSFLSKVVAKLTLGSRK
jgi:hypothetical protein